MLNVNGVVHVPVPKEEGIACIFNEPAVEIPLDEYSVLNDTIPPDAVIPPPIYKLSINVL